MQVRREHLGHVADGVSAGRAAPRSARQHVEPSSRGGGKRRPDARGRSRRADRAHRLGRRAERRESRPALGTGVARREGRLPGADVPRPQQQAVPLSRRRDPAWRFPVDAVCDIGPARPSRGHRLGDLSSGARGLAVVGGRPAPRQPGRPAAGRRGFRLPAAEPARRHAQHRRSAHRRRGQHHLRRRRRLRVEEMVDRRSHQALRLLL